MYDFRLAETLDGKHLPNRLGFALRHVRTDEHEVSEPVRLYPSKGRQSGSAQLLDYRRGAIPFSERGDLNSEPISQ